jgi:hypothetical protein
VNKPEWSATWREWASEVVHEQLAWEYLYEAALFKKGLLWPTIHVLTDRIDGV